MTNEELRNYCDGRHDFSPSEVLALLDDLIAYESAVEEVVSICEPLKEALVPSSGLAGHVLEILEKARNDD